MSKAQTSFIGGVTEGFNGRPWNARQRHQLFGWMRTWKLNTYVYAAKGDLKQRQCWRDLYADMEVAEMSALIRDCQRHEIDFVFALNPGLDLCRCTDELLAALISKVRQVFGLSCKHFALLLDDLPTLIQRRTAADFQHLAESHCRAANGLRAVLSAEVPESELMLCPAVSCSRDATHQTAYLESIGKLLDPGIEILWTGPGGIPETVDTAVVREAHSYFRRKPILWDNLFANDYDSQRLHLGPYSGRPLEMQAELRGILCNPNCLFEANYVPLRTFAQFLGSRTEWDPRAAYLAGIREWLPQFASDGKHRLELEDIELLGDLFYLPHACGQRVQGLLENLSWLLRTPSSAWGERLGNFLSACDRIDQLTGKAGLIRNRELFFALFSSLSRLKTELAYVRAWLDARQADSTSAPESAIPGFPSEIFRGGLVGTLQHLLPTTESDRC